MIKKICLLLSMLLVCGLVLTACGKEEDAGANENQVEIVSEEASSEKPSEEETKASVINDKPAKLYYMNYETNTAELVTSYSSPWDAAVEIGTFGAFNSGDVEIPFDNEGYAHYDLWESVDTALNYKIGYELSFELNGKTEIITILEPDDVEKSDMLFMGDADGGNVTGYMGVWLYDDIANRDSGGYIHITQPEVTENTLLTSIKFRPTPQSDEISSFKVKVFSYSSDLEFDKNGHYNGDYGYEVSIVNE